MCVAGWEDMDLPVLVSDMLADFACTDRLQCVCVLLIDRPGPFEASCMNGTPHPTHWGDPTLWAKANIQMQTKRYSYAKRAVCHSPPRRPPPR